MSFRIIDPSVVVSLQSEPHFIMQTIEDAGRTCYKSGDKTNATSYGPFIERLVRRNHEAVLEHGVATAHFRIDRGVSHELVRHRLAAFAQESTRYCNYKDKAIEFVKPSWITDEDLVAVAKSQHQNMSDIEDKHMCAVVRWFDSCQHAHDRYHDLLNYDRSPQEARAVLTNSLATDLVVTANLREWRHILKLRCAKEAHPDMRQVMLPLLSDMYQLFPPVFKDIYETYKEEVDALNRKVVYVLPHTKEETN